MTETRPYRQPPVMGVYYNPEERLGRVTLHESWSIDDGHACYGTFDTREEAEAAAVRLHYEPVLMRGKPSANGPSTPTPEEG